MSLLAIDVGAALVTALVVSPDGRVAARDQAGIGRHEPRPGWVEHAPEEIWQATLRAVRGALEQVDAAGLSAVGVTNQRDTVLLWDRETLGSPRRAIAGEDRRTTDVCARLRWLAENEPHTWALVESGQYAISTLDSYLVARMTRGTWHVTDVANAARTRLLDLGTGTWSAELCSASGVPLDALPELVPSWGEVAVSDPRVFLGLTLPVAGLAADSSATLVGLGCLATGTTAYDGLSALTVTGTTPVPVPGLPTSPAWRSPAGVTTYVAEAVSPDGQETGGVLRVGGPHASDDAWCQGLADRTGLRVERPVPVETTAALGAAFLAGLGTGVWSSTDELHALRPTERTFEPTRS